MSVKPDSVLKPICRTCDHRHNPGECEYPNCCRAHITQSAFEDRYGKMADEYLAEVRALFMQSYAPLVATGEWVPSKASVVALHGAAQQLADMVMRGERIRNEQPIR